MSADVLTVNISYFPSVTTLSAEVQDFTLSALFQLIRNAPAVSKLDGALIKLGRFRGDSRAEGAILESISGLEVDYDGGRISFEVAVAAVRKLDVPAILYTSTHHTPKAPRWRLLVFFTRPINNSAGARRSYVEQLHGLLAAELSDGTPFLTHESFDDCLCYFFQPAPGPDAKHRQVVGVAGKRDPESVLAQAGRLGPVGGGTAAAEDAYVPLPPAKEIGPDETHELIVKVRGELSQLTRQLKGMTEGRGTHVYAVASTLRAAVEAGATNILALEKAIEAAGHDPEDKRGGRTLREEIDRGLAAGNGELAAWFAKRRLERDLERMDVDETSGAVKAFDDAVGVLHDAPAADKHKYLYAAIDAWNAMGVAGQNEAQLAHLCEAAARRRQDMLALIRARRAENDVAAAAVARAQDGEAPVASAFGTLRTTAKGTLLDKFDNVVILVDGLKELQGVLAYDTWGQQMVKCADSDLFGDAGEWADVDDLSLHHLIQQRYGIGTKQAVQDAVVRVAHSRSFNPITDYLEDCAGRYPDAQPINWVAEFLAGPDDEYTRTVVHKWTLGAVWRAMEPGVSFKHALVLEGGQGSGKSPALKLLMPEPQYCIETQADLEHKDTPFTLGRGWVVEFSEEASLTRKSAAVIKAFISMTQDSGRAAYGRHYRTTPRHTVYAITHNGPMVLRDQTGNVRFWPVSAPGRPDVWGALDELIAARDEIWAAAVHAYRRGERPYLTPDQFERLAKPHQDDRLEVPAYAERIEAYLARIPELKEFTLHQLTEGLDLLKVSGQAQLQRELAASLRYIGFDNKPMRREGKLARYWFRKG